jgi:hypothetical protein
MTIAAPGGRRLASTSRLKCSVENLSLLCNPDATDRLCPLDCISHHILDASTDQLVTLCLRCGMRVDLATWHQNIAAGTRPWSRWGRAR